ncbi:MAG: HAMP domain-containing protein [Armatimonadetes bacterium]|nr:HAMP domain-containing protein [Armatimonadota bacterium]
MRDDSSGNRDIIESVRQNVPFGKSLMASLIALVGLILVLAFVAFSLLNVRTTDNKLMEEYAQSADKLARTVQKSLRYAMLKVDWEYVRQTLAAVEELHDIEQIRVVDGQGRVRIDSIGLHRDKESASGLKGYIDRVASSDQGIRWTSPGNRYHLLNPIRNEPSCMRACHSNSGKHLGYLNLEIDITDAMSQIARTRRILIVSAVLTLLAVALAIAYVIHFLVHRPVLRLAQTMAAVEAGNLDTHVELDVQNEIGWLASSFNRMVDRVKANREAVVEAQKQVAQSEKLAAIGLLAAGVAHEINNPLATISMSAEALLSESCTMEQREYFLDTIAGESERIGQIVAQLLTLDRQQRQERTPADVNALLDIVLAAVQNIAKSQGVAITADLDRTLPPVTMDAERMRQAFLNIASNGVQAMPDGGCLTVTTRRERGEAAIRFRDEGIGIPPENLEHIFEPFFTTKETGEGFGLGLAVTRETVLKHGGRIDIDSEPGRGTEVTVFLPITQKAEVAETHG